MTFDMSEFGLDDSLEEVQDAFTHWAERNNYHVFEEGGPRGLTLKAKVGEMKTVILDPHGNVYLEQRASLGGADGELKFTDKSFIVADNRGEKSIVNDTSFPIHKGDY